MTPPFDVELQLRRHGTALRRLAFELVGDPANADDAVQETWLQAMRSPPRHHVGVAGWLTTVLRNVVHRSRRVRARRARWEASAVKDDVVEDVAMTVGRDETVRRLLDAVAALDPPYRDVIWARWLEGRPPREIAAASGEPIATVKSRLQCGLRMLRERLGKDGDGDWRAAFAVAFGFGKKGATTAALAGGIVMATWMKLSAAAVVIAAIGLAWPWSSRKPVPSSEAVSPRQEVPGVASADLQAVETPALERESGVPVDGASVVPVPSAAAPAVVPTATVRGRAVDAVTREPLGGVVVTLSAGKTNSDPSVPSVTTAADGRFEFVVLADKRVAVGLRGDGRVNARTQVKGIAAGDSRDVGDVGMRPGRFVRGRVVDEAGAPIPPNTFVHVRSRPDGAAAAHTDEVGRFVTQEAIGFGPTTWRLPDGPFELPEPVNIDIGPEEPAEVVLTVRARPRIRGVVVDDTDAPATNARLLDPFGVSVAVAADGSFTLFRGSDDRGPGTTIRVEGAGFEMHEPIVDVPWGTENLRIRLRRTTPFPLEVVDAAGTPIEAFGVVVHRPGSQLGDVRWRGVHPRGRLDLVGVIPGKTLLRVVPSDRTWSPSEPIAAANDGAQRIVLDRRIPLQVSVRRAGVACEQTFVQLVRDRGKPTLLDAAAVAKNDPPRRRLPKITDPTTSERVWITGDGSELVDSGATDANGRVTLLRDADLAGCSLRLQAPGRPWAFVGDLVVPAAGEPLRIELPGHGTINGRVALHGRDHEPLRVHVPAAQRTGFLAVDVASDGSFVVPEVQEGDYEVVLHRVRVGVGTPMQGASTFVLATRTVRVVAGAPSEVAFDLAEWSVGAVRGVVTAAAELPADLAVTFHREADGQLSRFGEARVAPDGSFALPELPAGPYRVAIRSGAGSGAAPALVPEIAQIAAGGTAQLSLRFEPRRLVVRFVRANGAAVRGSRVLTRCAGAVFPMERILTPTVFETMVLEPAPLQPLEFREWVDGSAWSQSVQMPAGRAEAEVTVVLPDPPK